jgi:hypothetical protein
MATKLQCPSQALQAQDEGGVLLIVRGGPLHPPCRPSQAHSTARFCARPGLRSALLLAPCSLRLWRRSARAQLRRGPFAPPCWAASSGGYRPPSAAAGANESARGVALFPNR